MDGGLTSTAAAFGVFWDSLTSTDNRSRPGGSVGSTVDLGSCDGSCDCAGEFEVGWTVVVDDDDVTVVCSGDLQPI
jgi:hypothetical protein